MSHNRCRCLLLLGAFLLIEPWPGAAEQPAPSKVQARVKELNAAADDAWNKSEWDAVISNKSEVLRIQPDDDDALVGRAYAWLKKKQFDKALADYDTALKLKPNDSGKFALRSQVYIGKNDFAAALRDLTKAIELNPQFQEAYYFRGAPTSRGDER